MPVLGDRGGYRVLSLPASTPLHHTLAQYCASHSRSSRSIPELSTAHRIAGHYLSTGNRIAVAQHRQCHHTPAQYQTSPKLIPSEGPYAMEIRARTAAGADPLPARPALTESAAAVRSNTFDHRCSTAATGRWRLVSDFAGKGESSVIMFFQQALEAVEV
eukprot:2839017-Rhodomonas_salina.2